MLTRVGSSACRHVATDLPSRCRAIRDVLRPWEVAHLVEGAREHACRCHEHAVEGAACFLLRLGIEYEADPPRKDYWCAPSVTLRRRRGDCDDFSVLAASLLRAMGMEALVVLGWHDGVYHAWVAGRCSCGKFFVMEPQTGEVWHDIPVGYDAEYVIAPEGCWRVNRRMALLAAA